MDTYKLQKILEQAKELMKRDHSDFSEIEIQLDSIATLIAEYFCLNIQSDAPSLPDVFKSMEKEEGIDVAAPLEQFQTLQEVLKDAYSDGLEPWDIEELSIFAESIITMLQPYTNR